MRFGAAFLFFLLSAWDVNAHVGSPNVFYQGNAGPYPVRVVVRPPGVVPGLAEISVRVEANDVRRVTVLPVFWNAGRKGAPPADEAKLVRGETNLFATTLWLMKSGAYSVDVSVEGTLGGGCVVVPVNSMAIARRRMSPWFGLMLAALGLGLFVGAVRIAGAAFGEATREPGHAMTRSDTRCSRIAMTIAALIFALVLTGGKAWWDRTDAEYRHDRLFQPIPVSATVRHEGTQRVLRLEVERSNQRRPEWTPLIPDHGKMMHMFLVREPRQDAFAHLHPIQRHRRLFEVALPPLPAGDYRIYADVTHENGFAHTLLATAHLPEPADRTTDESGNFLSPDPDDSWFVNGSNPSPTGSLPQKTTSALPGGCMMHWQIDRPLRENQEASLRFKIVDARGKPVALEPYMGMLGHAAVRREDGAVFAHLHPVGSISMASQDFFTPADDAQARRSRSGPATSESSATSAHMDHSQHLSEARQEESISFPYEFPRAGRYRIWVQVKSSTEVMTGVFDAEVMPARK